MMFFFRRISDNRKSYKLTHSVM